MVKKEIFQTDLERPNNLCLHRVESLILKYVCNIKVHTKSAVFMCLVKRRRNLNIWKKAATCVFCTKGTKSHVTYQKTGKLHVCLLVFRSPLPVVGSMLLVTSTD